MITIVKFALIFSLLPVVTEASFIDGPYNADTTKQRSLSELLIRYYDLKDALVNSDASAASAKAGKFLDGINNVDTKSLSGANKKAFASLQPKLAYDARHISEVKSIDHQREHFASLSANMYKLAKAAKISSDPIYEMYCPMKKTYWLSREEVVKNPYYGKQMLSCGKVADKIQ